DGIGKIYISCEIYDGGIIKIKIKDNGCGIDNVEKAMEPLFTTVGGERAGLGFAVMQSFMDGIKVRSVVGKGTTVTLSKRICPKLTVNG
ncbi:MAG: ATP-binding protein, partial [Clostridia bacterium]|nr:ATP-binding protein [Clostridia bacterium]